MRDRVLALADADDAGRRGRGRRVARGGAGGPVVGSRPDLRGGRRRRRDRRARRLDAHTRRRARRRPPLRPPARRVDLPGLPAPWLPPARSLLHAGCRVRRGGAEVPAALRRGDREAARAAARPARALRLRGAPRPPRPLLPRARPLLAGRVLGQRRARLRAQPRLPSARAARARRPRLRRSPARRARPLRRSNRNLARTRRAAPRARTARSTGCSTKRASSQRRPSPSCAR